MKYRTVICVMLAVVGVALACSVITDRDEQAVPATAQPVATMVPPELRDVEIQTEPIEYSWEEAGDSATEASTHTEEPRPLSLSERILRSDVIARARLTSVAPSSWWYYYGQRKAYAPAVAFTFDMKEALYGSPGETVVVGLLLSKPWENNVPAAPYKTEAKALEVSRVWNETRRVTDWDERDTIIFLSLASNVSESWKDGVPSTVQYVFVSERSIGGNARMSEDEYTIHSTKNQVWLPAVSVGEAGSQTFYLDDPKIVNLPATKSLVDLKADITTETAKVDSSIPGHKECLLAKEQDERDGRPTYPPAFWSQVDVSIPSGSPTNTPLMGERSRAKDGYPTHFLEGPDSDWFTTKQSDTDTNALNGFSHSYYTTRPLPARVYEFHTNIQKHRMKPCNYIPPYRVKWLVKVESPEGTLHELFFDPVTVGPATAADSTNGVLKPTSFTDANGASVSIEGISYESSSVKVKVSPYTGLTGHRLYFIELDGTVSLSLQVDEATVDAANGTLRWAVEEQPWHDGDKLMVRIREAR
ncbi:MAG: hypothetical protein OXD46_10345 [Chloroflexi bacterium]|nr:hypothetical protein [Chloroflexota bacterium]